MMSRAPICQRLCRNQCHTGGEGCHAASTSAATVRGMDRPCRSCAPMHSMLCMSIAGKLGSWEAGKAALLASLLHCAAEQQLRRR